MFLILIKEKMAVIYYFTVGHFETLFKMSLNKAHDRTITF